MISKKKIKLIFKRPFNIISSSSDLLIFSITNHEKKIVVYNIKKKFFVKKKRKDTNSRLVSFGPKKFLEFKLNCNYFYIRNLNYNLNKKIELAKNLKIQNIITQGEKILVSAINEKKNFFVIIKNLIPFYKITKYNFSNFTFTFFDNKIFAFCKIHSKLYEYFFDDDFLKYKFGQNGRFGKYSFRNVNFIFSSNKYLIINDRDNYLIKFYDKNLKFFKSFGSKGLAKHNIDFVESFSVNNNNLFIADTNNDRIIKLSDKFKSEIILKAEKSKNNFRRPIKTLHLKEKFYILDRESQQIKIFDKYFKFKKKIDIDHDLISKPNSFTKLFYNNNYYFIILFRNSRFKNFLKFYDIDFKFLFKKKINTKDAQDIHGYQDKLLIADTLGRRLIAYKFNLKVYFSLNMKKISSNNRILIKSIDSFENNILLVDFEKCIIFFINATGILIKKINLSKFSSELKVIRFVKYFDKKLYILSRNKKPLWIYYLKNKKIKKFLSFGNGDKKLLNPSHILLHKKKVLISDKENDQVKILNNRLKIDKILP